jgi:hypothetical protein
MRSTFDAITSREIPTFDASMVSLDALGLVMS